MCILASLLFRWKRATLVCNLSKLSILSINQTWRWISSGGLSHQKKKKNQRNSFFIINCRRKKLSSWCSWEKWLTVKNKGKKICKKSTILLLKRKLIPENFWKENEKEPSLPSPENTRQLKKQSKMIYSYSKIAFSKSSHWLEKYGQTAKSLSQSPSCPFRQILTIVWLIAMSHALKRGSHWS